jgi:hypothetical protein
MNNFLLNFYRGDGKLNGKGLMSGPDGMFIGEWKNDHQHGFGSFFSSEEKVLDGEWINGKFVG